MTLILGHAYDGTIVVFNRLRKMDPTVNTDQENINFIILMNDYVVKKCQKYDQVYSIIDTHDLGYKNVDIDRFKKNQPRIGTMVPDILKKGFIVRCGWWVKAAYNTVKPFINRRTKEKLFVMGSELEENRKVFGEIMDLKILPKEVGGDLENFE